MCDAPDELSLAFAYLRAPADDPDVPAALRGELTAIVAGMHAGSADEGEQALRPIRELGPASLDAFGPVPYADLQCSLDDPPGYRNDDGPLAGRDARFAVHPLMLWEDPADDQRVTAWGRAFRDALREHATGVSYLNFTGDEVPPRARATYRPGAADRLARIKAVWDPENVFRAVGNIASASRR